MKVLFCDKTAKLFNTNKVFVQQNGKYNRVLDKYINISQEFSAEPYSSFYSGLTFVSIGSFSYFNSIVPANDLDMRVGRYCSIASGLKVLGINHPIDRFTTSSVSYDKTPIITKHIVNNKFIVRGNPNNKKSFSINIENDVWIGGDVTLCRGITIGNGAVIAAGSIVTKDVPPYAVVAGNPARIIKFRFNSDIVHELIQTKWWEYNYSEFEISAAIDIKEFITYINSCGLKKFAPEKITYNKIIASQL